MVLSQSSAETSINYDGLQTQLDELYGIAETLADKIATLENTLAGHGQRDTAILNLILRLDSLISVNVSSAIQNELVARNLSRENAKLYTQLYSEPPPEQPEAVAVTKPKMSVPDARRKSGKRSGDKP